MHESVWESLKKTIMVAFFLLFFYPQDVNAMFVEIYPPKKKRILTQNNEYLG